MSFHPGKKQLIDFAADSLSKKAYESVALHINECKECSDTVSSLKAILKASDNTTLAPPTRVKSRVFGQLNEAQKKSKRTFTLRALVLRPALYASIIVIAVLSIFIYTKQKSFFVSENIILRLSKNTGSVFHNGSLLQNKTADINTGFIKTEVYSSAILSVEQAVSVKIAENSELAVISAAKTAEKDNVEYKIALDLQKGNILASSNHNIKKKFTITTKHAFFEAMGTEFIIFSDDLMSKASVLNGIVRATSKADGKVILLAKGEGCTVTDTLFQKIIIDTENETGKFLNLFNKVKPGSRLNEEKTSLKDMSAENKDTGIKEENLYSGDKVQPLKENKHDQIKRTREEMQREGRQIQREIRNNLKSGKRSQR